MKHRPKCCERRMKDCKPCQNSARYYVAAPAYKNGLLFVCGLHARGFTANALHPLRLKDLDNLTQNSSEGGNER